MMEILEKMKRIGSIILCAAAFFICCMMIVSCGAAGESAAETEDVDEDAEEIRIGIAFDSFLIERWERDRDIFVSCSRDLNATVNVQNANGDVERQKEQIEYLIDRKMDVIVIIAVDSEELREEALKAKSEGIKVVAYDRLVTDVPLDLYVSFDNEEVGRLMADAIIEKLPEGGEVMKINGPLKDNNVSLVNKGFDEEIEGHGIEVFDTYYASEWNGEEAFRYLADNPDKAERADAIMCGNDSLAGQAVMYYSEIRRAGEVPIVGQDADLDACQRIVEGTQTMTVYKSIEQLAKSAAEASVALAEGKEVDGTVLLNNGAYEVPYLSITPVAVQQDNMDSVIIDGGFHLREDVYLKERQ